MSNQEKGTEVKNMSKSSYKLTYTNQPGKVEEMRVKWSVQPVYVTGGEPRT
jgi:hypothetical protein